MLNFSLSLKLTALLVMLFTQHAAAAVNYYMAITQYNNNQALFQPTQPGVVKIGPQGQPAIQLVDGFTFDVEQTLNIGSQSTGAGAGKIAFNPIQFTRVTDAYTPAFFQAAASGTAFKRMTIFALKNGGTSDTVSSSTPYLTYNFNLVAVKAISFSANGADPAMETVTMEYGALDMKYIKQNADGTYATNSPVAAGWNKVKNISCVDTQCENVAAASRMFRQ